MLSTVLYSLVFIYIGLSLAIFFFQQRLVFLPHTPSRKIESTPKTIGLAFESLEIKTADQETLSAWFIPHPQAKKTVLFFHGNAGNISHRLDSIALFHRLEVNILIFDYRGYGQSTGKPSEAGSYQDALVAWSYLTETRNILAPDIVLFGRSLGAGVMTQLATVVEPAGIIIESSFTSVPDMGAHLYPFLPIRTLARIIYPVIENVKTIHADKLIIHSRHDELIPFAHGEAIFAAAREPKNFLEMRGGHNDGFILSGSLYVDTLKDFLEHID